jgi:transcription elongation GreA/GreB family factor
MPNKSLLKQACVDALAQKIAVLQNMMHEVQASANNETKSTAGDKHETAKAHAQNETERIGKQLQLLQQMEAQLQRIRSEAHTKIQLGSLVETNLGYFYLSVALGKVRCEDMECMAISMNAPLGVLLVNKVAGDAVLLPNGSTCSVKEVH